MATLARRERLALCDLALVLGPDAPTCSGDWTVRDMVAHLLVRERSLLGAPGIVVPALSRFTDREMARVSRRPFPDLVERLRSPGLTPYALPGVEQLLNTLEYFVHHEDLRRAQPGWQPRELARRDEDLLWKAVKVAGIGLARPAGVPVRIARSDAAATATLRRGHDPVGVTGHPSELVLFLYGRPTTRLELQGPDDKVARLRRADLGI
jgi:uncharacterized protein (TIGR03085 family)